MNFVFDIDGTISFDGHTLDIRIKDTLNEGVKRGHNIIFASARSYRDCINVLTDDLNKNTIVALNGGLIYKNGKLVKSYVLDLKAFKSIYDFCHKNELPYFVDDTFNYSCNLEEEMPFINNVDPLKLARRIDVEQMYEPIKMVIGFKNRMNLLESLLDICKDFDSLELVFHERETCLYINFKGVSKASSLKDMYEDNFIAFGNDKNDIEMFKVARYAIQVGNYEELLPYANYVIKMEDDYIDEIAKIIYKLYDKEKI